MEYTFHNINESSNQLFKRPEVHDADPHWSHQKPLMDSLLFLLRGQGLTTGGGINDEYRCQVRASRYTNILPTNQLGNTLAWIQVSVMISLCMRLTSTQESFTTNFSPMPPSLLDTRQHLVAWPFTDADLNSSSIT